MPPVPLILFINPSDSEVVAFPRIFGPITLNMVDIAANIITANTAILYFPMYAISLLIEPLKSFAFSAGIPGPPCPGPLPTGGLCVILRSSITNLDLLSQFFS